MYFFMRKAEGRVQLVWCNSLDKAREFAQTGWTRISEEEYEAYESQRIASKSGHQTGRRIAKTRGS